MISSKETKFVSAERYPATTRGRVHQALCALLIAGNGAFGLASLAMPRRVAEVLDVPEDDVKRVGRMDLAAAVGLASSRKRPVVPLAMNAVADAREGVRWLKTKPVLAVVMLAWALISVAAILTRDQEAS